MLKFKIIMLEQIEKASRFLDLTETTVGYGWNTNVYIANFNRLLCQNGQTMFRRYVIYVTKLKKMIECEVLILMPNTLFHQILHTLIAMVL